MIEFARLLSALFDSVFDCVGHRLVHDQRERATVIGKRAGGGAAGDITPSVGISCTVAGNRTTPQIVCCGGSRGQPCSFTG